MAKNDEEGVERQCERRLDVRMTNNSQMRVCQEIYVSVPARVELDSIILSFCPVVGRVTDTFLTGSFCGKPAFGLASIISPKSLPD